MKDEDSDQFFTYLKHLGSGQFSKLDSFYSSVMFLSYSNARCERIFSKMNRIKISREINLLLLLFLRL